MQAAKDANWGAHGGSYSDRGLADWCRVFGATMKRSVMFVVEVNSMSSQIDPIEPEGHLQIREGGQPDVPARPVDRWAAPELPRTWGNSDLAGSPVGFTALDEKRYENAEAWIARTLTRPSMKILGS